MGGWGFATDPTWEVSQKLSMAGALPQTPPGKCPKSSGGWGFPTDPTWETYSTSLALAGGEWAAGSPSKNSILHSRPCRLRGLNDPHCFFGQTEHCCQSMYLIEPMTYG